MRKQIRMITYLPYYHLDAAFDNGLRKDYGNSEIRYDHFYYKEKKLSFTRQEDVYKRSLQAVLHIQYTDMNLQESVTMEEANEGERD